MFLFILNITFFFLKTFSLQKYREIKEFDYNENMVQINLNNNENCHDQNIIS